MLTCYIAGTHSLVFNMPCSMLNAVPYMTSQVTLLHYTTLHPVTLRIMACLTPCVVCPIAGAQYGAATIPCALQELHDDSGAARQPGR